MPWDLLPQSPRKVNTKFYLSTRENPRGKRIYPLRLNSLKFRNRKTIIVVHGWKGKSIPVDNINFQSLSILRSRLF